MGDTHFLECKILLLYRFTSTSTLEGISLLYAVLENNLACKNKPSLLVILWINLKPASYIWGDWFISFAIARYVCQQT
jgi:hypothetical protein